MPRVAEAICEAQELIVEMQQATERLRRAMATFWIDWQGTIVGRGAIHEQRMAALLSRLQGLGYHVVIWTGGAPESIPLKWLGPEGAHEVVSKPESQGRVRSEDIMVDDDLDILKAAARCKKCRTYHVGQLDELEKWLDGEVP